MGEWWCQYLEIVQNLHHHLALLLLVEDAARRPVPRPLLIHLPSSPGQQVRSPSLGLGGHKIQVTTSNLPGGDHQVDRWPPHLPRFKPSASCPRSTKPCVKLILTLFKVKISKFQNRSMGQEAQAMGRTGAKDFMVLWGSGMSRISKRWSGKLKDHLFLFQNR